MPTGYLVTLGDGSLDAGDTISGGAITFSADTGYPSGLGAGQWTWSGTEGGFAYNNELEPGQYWLATDGNVYFVPDFGPVDTLSSATVTSAPSYSASDGIVSGGSGDDFIDTGFTDSDGDVVDGADGTGASGNEDTINAGDGNDTVFAGQESDTVYGGSGNDSLSGESGNDSLYGGDDNDTLEGGAGADYLEGGGGLDFASYENSDSAVNVNLQSGTATGGHAAGDTFFGIDGLIGSDFDDTLVGYDAAGPDYTNIIDGGAGDDYIDGLGSDDTLIGGEGGDTILGGTGSDDIQGDNVVESNQISNGTFDTGTTGWTSAGDGGVQNGAFVWGSDNASGTLTYDSSLVGLQDGPGANGAGQITFDFAWNNGQPDVSGTRTLELQIDGTTYATITTGGLNGPEATITYTNGASGPVSTVAVNPGYVGGASPVFTSITVDLPAGVTDTGTLSFVASSGGARDDMAIDNVQVITNSVTSGDDSIDGGSGDDIIDGGGGSDTILGGSGNDTISLGNDGDRDYVALEDGSGTDTITGFDLADSGDGITIDQLDVSGLTDAEGNPVNAWDVVVTDTNGDGTGDAILTFPNGENITLQGVLPSQVDDISELTAIGIPCFTAGTQIRTPYGEEAVENLHIGQMVETLEHGPLPVRWIARTDLGDGKTALPTDQAPVRIKPGTLGNRRALLISPQHCIMMTERSTGAHHYVRAKHLAEETRLASYAKSRNRVTYVHVLLDRHVTLISNDIPSESFYPGPVALQALAAIERLKLCAVLPGLSVGPVNEVYGARAAPVLRRKDLCRLSSAKALTQCSINSAVH